MSWTKPFLKASFTCFMLVQPIHCRAQSIMGMDFSARSADGTTIQGILETPPGRSLGTVVMVPGTGGFSRDVQFGISGSDEDKIFRTLAQDLVQQGLAVARFDEPGWNCANLDQKTCAGLKSRITDRSKSDDIAAVVDAVVKARKDKCLIILAHSEGMLNVARLVEEKRIMPSALIGIGALMDSPARAYWWQRVWREADSLRSMEDSHGDVSASVLKDRWSHTPVGVFPFNEAYVPKSGRLTKDEIDRDPQQWQAIYDRERADALGHADNEPYSAQGTPISSYAWWKQWFSDWRPVASRLSDFEGRVLLFYGAKDSQTPPQRQEPLAREFMIRAKLGISVYEDRGHTLGDHPLFGPLGHKERGNLVQQVHDLALGCR
jgi:pimeloyl-ACP methyl ester carboxylesterase